MNILQGANRYRTIQEIAELDTVFSGIPVTRLAYAENPGNDSTWRPSPAIRRHTLPAGAIVTIVASAQTAAIDAYFELANTATGGIGTLVLEQFTATKGQKDYTTVGKIGAGDNAIAISNAYPQSAKIDPTYAPTRIDDNHIRLAVEAQQDGDLITIPTLQ